MCRCMDENTNLAGVPPAQCNRKSDANRWLAPACSENMPGLGADTTFC